MPKSPAKTGTKSGRGNNKPGPKKNRKKPPSPDKQKDAGSTFWKFRIILSIIFLTGFIVIGVYFIHRLKDHSQFPPPKITQRTDIRAIVEAKFFRQASELGGSVSWKEAAGDNLKFVAVFNNPKSKEAFDQLLTGYEKAQPLSGPDYDASDYFSFNRVFYAQKLIYGVQICLGACLYYIRTDASADYLSFFILRLNNYFAQGLTPA